MDPSSSFETSSSSNSIERASRRISHDDVDSSSHSDGGERVQATADLYMLGLLRTLKTRRARSTHFRQSRNTSPQFNNSDDMDDLNDSNYSGVGGAQQSEMDTSGVSSVDSELIRGLPNRDGGWGSGSTESSGDAGFLRGQQHLLRVRHTGR